MCLASTTAFFSFVFLGEPAQGNMDDGHCRHYLGRGMADGRVVDSHLEHGKGGTTETGGHFFRLAVDKKISSPLFCCLILLLLFHCCVMHFRRTGAGRINGLLSFLSALALCFRAL
ncbi:hypothetical protein B0H67DRAFT_309514 [Lasiosphaeris hirsuta]|uniref:Secreted protein n=1 Tax=Lasiosphaeris hirsuta TaxID=260670 RepID=A0AA40A163_9PEZI|nr:hypothetical protein B0H67DRAFT_309514 [Lasiosphaeris hirsuta]